MITTSYITYIYHYLNLKQVAVISIVDIGCWLKDVTRWKISHKDEERTVTQNIEVFSIFKAFNQILEC